MEETALQMIQIQTQPRVDGSRESMEAEDKAAILHDIRVVRVESRR